MSPNDLFARYGISADRVAQYEGAGVLKGIHVDGSAFYEDLELRLAVIAKAESMGFSFDEIVALIRMGVE